MVNISICGFLFLETMLKCCQYVVSCEIPSFILFIFIHFCEMYLYIRRHACMCSRRKMETSCKTYFMSG